MFEHLFKPLGVNGMILKNRIIATPTGDDFEEKAMGGAALVIAGHAIDQCNLRTAVYSYFCRQERNMFAQRNIPCLKAGCGPSEQNTFKTHRKRPAQAKEKYQRQTGQYHKSDSERPGSL